MKPNWKSAALAAGMAGASAVAPEGWVMHRWEARGSVPGISREQLDKIKVKY